MQTYRFLFVKKQNKKSLLLHKYAILIALSPSSV